MNFHTYHTCKEQFLNRKLLNDDMTLIWLSYIHVCNAPVSLNTFSSLEAVLLLVSTKNRDLWRDPTPEVRDSRTARHSAHAQSQV